MAPLRRRPETDRPRRPIDGVHRGDHNGSDTMTPAQVLPDRR
jgi:hypothetical protein